MKKPKIGLDADDNLINTMEAFNEFHNHKYGHSFAMEDYTGYNLAEIWDMNHYAVLDDEREFYESEFYKNVQPIPGAKQVILELSKRRDLVIITGRGKDIPQYLPVTLNTLFGSEHFHSFHHLGPGYSPSPRIQKWETCVEHDIKILMDDYHETLIKAAEKGIHGILFPAPWNKHVTDLPKLVTRVNNWEEALAVFEAKEKLILV